MTAGEEEDREADEACPRGQLGEHPGSSKAGARAVRSILQPGAARGCLAALAGTCTISDVNRNFVLPRPQERSELSQWRVIRPAPVPTLDSPPRQPALSFLKSHFPQPCLLLAHNKRGKEDSAQPSWCSRPCKHGGETQLWTLNQGQRYGAYDKASTCGASTSYRH